MPFAPEMTYKGVDASVLVYQGEVLLLPSNHDCPSYPTKICWVIVTKKGHFVGPLWKKQIEKVPYLSTSWIDSSCPGTNYAQPLVRERRW